TRGSCVMLHWSSGARVAPALLCGLLLSSPMFAAPSDAQRIERILAQTPLIDGHNDLPWEIRERFGGDLTKIDLSQSTAPLPAPAGSPPLMTDIPRLRAGHVGAQFWSVFIPVEVQGPAAVQMTIEQIDLVKQMCARYPHDLAMAYTEADIGRHHAHGARGDRSAGDLLAFLGARPGGYAARRARRRAAAGRRPRRDRPGQILPGVCVRGAPSLGG